MSNGTASNGTANPLASLGNRPACPLIRNQPEAPPDRSPGQARRRGATPGFARPRPLHAPRTVVYPSARKIASTLGLRPRVWG
jgi:hypothetical protein